MPKTMRKYVKVVDLAGLLIADPEAYNEWTLNEEADPLLSRFPNLTSLPKLLFAKPEINGGWVLEGELRDMVILGGWNPIKKFWSFYEYDTEDDIDMIYGYPVSKITAGNNVDWEI